MPDAADAFVRASSLSDRPIRAYAVVVDLPVNEAVREQLRRETGVELPSVATSARSAAMAAGSSAAPDVARAAPGVAAA